MAKGRRSRRVRHQPKPEAEGPQDPRATVPSQRGDVADRIEALRGEVRQARAEAERRGQPAGASDRPDGAPSEARPSPAGRPSHRDPVSPLTNPPIRGTGPIGDRPTLEPPYPRPGRTGRRLYALAALSVLVIAGVVAGVLASSGGRHAPKSPIAAYLAGHVPAGTPLAVIGSSRYALPTSYPTVTVTGSSLGSASSLRYVVAPDPVSAAGPAVAAFVQGHATMVAVDRGRASLWAVGPAAASPTTAVPATTAPATSPSTVAATTVPATTVPVTTVPATNVPATTVPPASGAPPTTAAPAPTAPPPSVPPGTGPTPVPPTTTVQAGQSFWSIATQVVQQHLGGTPTPAQVSRYWASLVAANAGRLPVPGNPDLIYPGTTLVLPAV